MTHLLDETEEDFQVLADTLKKLNVKKFVDQGFQTIKKGLVID